jgi:phospholipid transport system substrate-binding protein
LVGSRRIDKKGGRETTMRRHCMWLHFFLIIALIAPIPAHAASAIMTIQTQVDKVLDVLRNPAESKEEKERKILALADEIFDYTELSKLSLANYWKVFPPEQQKEFTRLFGKLLARDYMERIMMYTNEKVTFEKEIKLSENTIEVPSDIIAKTATTRMVYRMILENGEWKVYDVVVEGLSLVMNYRSQLREILASKSPEDLLRMLREKVGRWKVG